MARTAILACDSARIFGCAKTFTHWKPMAILAQERPRLDTTIAMAAYFPLIIRLSSTSSLLQMGAQKSFPQQQTLIIIIIIMHLPLGHSPRPPVPLHHRLEVGRKVANTPPRYTSRKATIRRHVPFQPSFHL
jgi:hypothetical protein